MSWQQCDVSVEPVQCEWMPVGLRLGPVWVRLGPLVIRLFPTGLQQLALTHGVILESDVPAVWRLCVETVE